MKNTINARLNAQLKAANLKGDVRRSIINLVTYGTARTGESGYSHGRASKSVWTSDTRFAAKTLGLVVVSGNDAPRGGANGEWVALVADKRKNRLIHQFQAIRSRAKAIARIRTERLRAETEARWKQEDAEINQLVLLVLPTAKTFADEFVATRQLTGQEKNDAFALLFKKVLQAAGNPHLGMHFWKVFRCVNAAI